MRIVVTGATGAVGGRVARLLAAADLPQTLLVRDPSRAPDLPAASVVQASYRDRDAARAALEGADAVLMVSAGESRDRREVHASFIDACTDAGVGHLVYTSFAGAADDATFTLARDHAAAERRLAASGLQVTVLRDNLYANLVPHFAGEDGVIRGPAGDGRAAVVARDDVAEVAAAVLRDPAPHSGQTYELTGPEALTFAEMAAVASEVLGRSLRFHDETEAEAYASRARFGAPDWQVEAWVSTYLAVANGELARVTDDVERLTGHPARSLREVLNGG